MSRLKEKLKALARKDRKMIKKTKHHPNRHYSSKPGHAHRSVANDPRKKSKRRGNY